MDENGRVSDLGELLDRIEGEATDREKVSLGMVLNAVGRRSFGPLLLVPGLVTVAPIIGDIPGVPTLMGVLVLLAAGQLVIGRNHIWLPQWLLRRSVDQPKLCKAIGWLRPVARFFDRLSGPRLTLFTRGAGAYVIALTCLLIAAALPPMEFVPFSANGAGAALTLFGIALVAHDGLFAVIGLVITIGTFVAVGFGLM